MKDQTYVVNLNEYKSIGTRWIALYVNGNSVTYFDSSGVEHILNKINKIIGNKKITRNIFRIWAYDLIMFGYFYIGFIGFMFKCKILTDMTNLFSSRNFEKNDIIILNYFLK